MLENDQTQNIPDQPEIEARLDGLEEDNPHSAEKRRRKKTSAVRTSEPNPYDRMASEPPESFGEVQ